MPSESLRLPKREFAGSAGLKLSPRAKGRRHLPIDFFLDSLAQERTDKAIGVVLSGIASDGTNGLQSVKAAGGVTFAQDPSTAQYDGMPRSAISSGAPGVVPARRRARPRTPAATGRGAIAT